MASARSPSARASARDQGGETVGVDGRPVIGCERREGTAAGFVPAAGARDVDDDAEDPCRQCRAGLETIQGPEHDDPCFLHGLLGRRRASDVDARQLQHPRAELIDKFHERALVAGS